MSDEQYEYGEDGLPKFVPKSKRKQGTTDEQTTKEETKVVTTSKKGSKKKKTTKKPVGARKLALFEAKLPGGGTIHLLNPVEVAYFEKLKKSYLDEYQLSKPNDLTRLAQLLVQELRAHRLTQAMMGQRALYTDTGAFDKYEAIDIEEQAIAADQLPKVQQEIRKLEEHLRLDKKAREAGGQHDIREYLSNLKEYARQYGVHLSERYEKYDELRNEISWRLRVLDNADENDQAYMQVSPDKIIDFLRKSIAELDDFDKSFAADKQALWVGSV